MVDELEEQIEKCRIEAESAANYREQLPEKADKIIEVIFLFNEIFSKSIYTS